MSVMQATLIEIDAGAPAEWWYAQYPGLRLWARRSYATSDFLRWQILPGQEVSGTYCLSERLWVRLEHAHPVRDSDVELVLREVTAVPCQVELHA